MLIWILFVNSLESNLEFNTYNHFNRRSAPVKPMLLKVLCIISFIACGLTIAWDLIGTITSFMSSEILDGLFSNKNLSESFQYGGANSARSLVTEIFSLLGVLMMWKLNRKGFYIYVVAELANYLCGVDFSLSWDAGIDFDYSTFIAFAPVLIGLIFDVAFFVLYGTQLKYMKRN